jgi:hypothetical protein
MVQEYFLYLLLYVGTTCSKQLGQQGETREVVIKIWSLNLSIKNKVKLDSVSLIVRLFCLMVHFLLVPGFFPPRTAKTHLIKIKYFKLAVARAEPAQRANSRRSAILCIIIQPSVSGVREALLFKDNARQF